MNQKGFSLLAIGIMLGVVTLGVGGYFVFHQKAAQNQSPNSLKNLEAALIDQIGTQGIDVGFPEDLKWSPADDATFALLPSPGDPITIYKLINNKIEKVATFEGYYSSFRWSRNGSHIIAIKQAGRYTTLPTSLVALDLKNSREELLVNPGELGQYNEVRPCTIAYVAKLQLKEVSIPDCSTADSYNPYAYYFYNPPVGDSRYFDVYYSQKISTDKIATLPFLKSREFEISISPRGTLYWKKGSFFDLQGRKVAESPLGRLSSSAWTWSFDGTLILYSKPISKRGCNFSNCPDRLFIFNPTINKEAQISGIPGINMITGASFSKNNKLIIFFGDDEEGSRTIFAAKIKN